jgi:putative transposase
MPRKRRIVLPGWPHHVTQRGNHRQRIFFSDHDMEVFLDIWSKHSKQYHTSLVGHALMPNHVHFIPIPEFETSLANAVGLTSNDFSRWQNLQCHRTGHLWQARFYSCPIAVDSVWDVLAYVELNPVRAGLVERAIDWKWSSAKAHLTGHDETGLLDMSLWRAHFTPASWADFLEVKKQDGELVNRIRDATRIGKPLAPEEVVRDLEQLLGLRLRLKRLRDTGGRHRSII